jgi:hypothetical protein
MTNLKARALYDKRGPLLRPKFAASEYGGHGD